MRQPFDPHEGSTAPYRPRQLAIPTQSMQVAPGAPPSSEQHLSPPPAQVSASQHLANPADAPQCPTYQPYSVFHPECLTEAAITPNHAVPSTPLLHPAAGTMVGTPTGAGVSIPWRGEKLATLVLILTTCVLQTIHFFFFWQIVRTNPSWLVILPMILNYVSTFPPVWWLLLAMRNLFRNQADSSMAAMSIWFTLETITLTSGTQKMYSHEVFAVLTIFMLLTSTVGAVLATLLNKRLSPSRTAPVTLSFASCQFVLVIGVLHIIELAWYGFVARASGISISEYSTGIWLIWLNSGGLGLSLTPGLVVTFIFISLSLGCLFIGAKTPHRYAFMIIAVATTSLLTAYNLAIIAVYGVSTQNTYAHWPFHTGPEFLAILVVGAILIGSAAAVGHRSTIAWFSRPISARGPHPG